MSLEIKKSKESNSFIHKLHGSLPSQLNVYNQAVIKRVEPLNIFTKAQNKNEKEISILFQLQGEMQGQILCTLDLTEKEFKNINMFQSLFTESMNILLGQFLTDLEDEAGILSMISSPQIIVKEKKNTLLEKHLGSYSLNIKTGYELLTLKDSYNCSIYILANTNTTKEV